MELEPPRRRWVGPAVLCVACLVLVAVLMPMVIYAAGRAASGDEAARAFYFWFSLVALTLLATMVIVLVWMLLHHLSVRARTRGPSKPTQYVNAWELAGQRFQLEEEPDDTPEDQES